MNIELGKLPFVHRKLSLQCTKVTFKNKMDEYRKQIMWPFMTSTKQEGKKVIS